MGEGRQGVPRLTSGPAPPGVPSDPSLLVLCSFQTRVSWGLWVCLSIQNPFWKKTSFSLSFSRDRAGIFHEELCLRNREPNKPRGFRKKKNCSTSVDFHCDQSTDRGGGRAGGTLPPSHILLLASSLPALL